MPTSVAALSLLLPLVLAPPFGRPTEPIGPTVPGGRTITPSQRRSIEEREPAGIQHTRCEEGSVTVSLPVIDLYPLLHTAGDADLGANAQLSVVAKIKPTKTRLFVTATATAADRRTRGSAGAGGSAFSKSKMFFKPVPVPVGCEIASVTEPAGRIRDNRTGDTPFRSVAGSGFVKLASCRAGVTGVDRGKVGCNRVTFQPIEVRFRKAVPTDCRGHVELKLPPQHLALSRMQGDPDMGLSNQTEIKMESKFQLHDNGKVSIRLSGSALTRGTFSRADGDVVREVFDPALDTPGCVARTMAVTYGNSPRRPVRGRRHRRFYEVVVSDTRGGFEYTTPTPAANPVSFSRVYGTRRGDTAIWGNLKSARCVLNTPGEDTGQIGCADIRFKTLKLFLAQGPE